MRSPGGGELSLSACPGVGNRPPRKKKLQIPGGVPGGGMVTGRIEPCITLNKNLKFCIAECRVGFVTWNHSITFSFDSSWFDTIYKLHLIHTLYILNHIFLVRNTVSCLIKSLV